MPEHCYWKTWSIPGTLSSTLEIVFIDTAILAPEVTPQTARGGIYEVSTEEVDANYRMIETRLRESTATWLLVAGHYTSTQQLQHVCVRVDGAQSSLRADMGTTGFSSIALLRCSPGTACTCTCAATTTP